MPVRERVLAMGLTGTGKSLQWLKMARRLKKKGVQFYCIDTDRAIEFMIAEQFPDLDNVHVYNTFEWPEFKKALTEIATKVSENDWVVLDMADDAWSRVQEFYTNEIWEKDKGDYFLQARKSLQERKGNKAKSLTEDTFKGWVDWPVINALYFDFMNKLIYQVPAHIYMTAKIQKLTGDDDPAVRALYAGHGIRPSGQKNLGHTVHTILLYSIDISNPDKFAWKVTTIKDRGNRDYFNKEPFSDFYVQYLHLRAGWEM